MNGGTPFTPPDRVIFLYDADGNELRRIEAADATPGNSVDFPDGPLKVASVEILAAGDVYA